MVPSYMQKFKEVSKTEPNRTVNIKEISIVNHLKVFLIKKINLATFSNYFGGFSIAVQFLAT